ncbi:MAG: hypothetical protein WDN75_03140 [Bacteroidota bacterium]
MRNKDFSKKLMLVAGILAAVIILFSQAFQKETCQLLSKIKSHKTEKTTEAEKKVIVAAPVDAVTSGTAVEVEDANASLIREIVLDENNTSKQAVIGKTLVANFFKTLFRVVISPQAP